MSRIPRTQTTALGDHYTDAGHGLAGATAVMVAATRGGTTLGAVAMPYSASQMFSLRILAIEATVFNSLLLWFQQNPRDRKVLFCDED